MPRKRRFSIIATGGTFDELHRGHKILLRRALELGSHVILGLTSDAFARRLHKSHRVAPFAKRKARLLRFLRKNNAGRRARLVPLEDPYGPTTKMPEIEAIVVSDETLQMAARINRIRKRKKLKPLEIVCLPMILAEDYKPISSTRIRRGKIDEEGYLRCLLA